MKNDQMYWSDGKIYRIAKVKNKLVKEDIFIFTYK